MKMMARKGRRKTKSYCLKGQYRDKQYCSKEGKTRYRASGKCRIEVLKQKSQTWNMRLNFWEVKLQKREYGRKLGETKPERRRWRRHSKRSKRMGKKKQTIKLRSKGMDVCVCVCVWEREREREREREYGRKRKRGWNGNIGRHDKRDGDSRGLKRKNDMEKEKMWETW